MPRSHYLKPLFAALACAAGFTLTACNGINTPGKMEWIQPTTTAPRVGTVYAIRGWMGVYSKGIDEMAQQANDKGVTAHVFQDKQYPEMAAAFGKAYKGVAHPEPIVFIGHSRGCDSSLIISRELDKAGIPVDMIICLDSVDEKTVPKNVKLVYNYWAPGIFGNTNLLRGIPLTPEPGFTGQIFNYNINKEYRSWKLPQTNHVTMDDDPKLQKRIVDNIMEVCVERSKWVAQSPGAAARASVTSAAR